MPRAGPSSRRSSINQPPPFDPRQAVERFVAVIREYGCASHVCGDKYAGQTFLHDFMRLGIAYDVSVPTGSKMYEAVEPRS
jgi:hypothetical protein